MKANFRRLLSCVLAVLMVVASFTFTAAAASYADVSTVSSATIIEINTGNPLDYEVGEDIVAQFQIKNGSTVLTAPSVHYSAVMDDGRTLTGNVSPVDGVYTITLKGGLRRPGFVLMTVSACDANGNMYTKYTTPKIEPYGFGAGADIDKIQSIYGVPDEYSDFGEFNAFWDETLAQLDADGGEASINYIYKCADVTYSGVTYDCYELEINCPKDDNYKDSWGGDNHVAAYLTIPQGKTDLKAQFLYKGYDWISASGLHTSIVPQSSICYPNYITISVSPHSIPAPHNVAEADASSTWVSDGAYIGDYYKNSSGGYLYDTYKYTNSHGNNTTENASPYTTYFKYMLMRDVQAVNFLKLYFNETGVSGTVNGVDTSVFAGVWDGANILTSGSSQGGYQALAVAGLDSDVNSVSAGVPWFADQGVTSADSDRYKPTSPRNFPYGEGLRYVDTANLATRISKDCNVTINAGLKDSLVPPSTVMSIYDLLNCNVTLKFNQNMGHGGSGQYSQSISKTVDTSEKSHTINYVSDFDASFKADFEAAWEKVCDTNVVSVDLYKVDKNTDIDFKTLATISTADGIGIVLTGEGLTNINAKLAEIYALHNDVNSKVWVIENNNALDGKNAAITFDACMNWGDRPTADGSIKLYTEDGELGQTSVLGANVPYAVIATPLWVSAQGILVDAENVTLKDGMLSTSVDEASVTFSAPAYSASYNMTGVGDAADYGNIEGIGLWVMGNDGTLTIKGAGAIPTYDSYADAPWAENNITNVVVSDGITSIGANAFAISGVTVNLPLSVAAIEVGAVSADATIVSYDNAYAKTFAKDNSIKFTNLGAIGSAGTDLTWLLDIDSGVLTIEGTGTKTYSGSGGWSSDGSKEKLSVFYPYKDQIKTIKFCDSVTNIGSKTFYRIDGLTTVELTPNIKTIENNAFGNCANLSTIYVKGNEPVTGTYDLTYVTSMTGGYQFDGSGKTTLKEVKLSDNLTGGLGDKFISYNSSLKSITIPAGVTSFSYRTFNQCTALKEVTFLGNPTIPNNFLLNVDEQVNKDDISKGYKTYIDTIYAKEGTNIQTWVGTANAKYEEIGVTHRVTFSALEEEPVAKGTYSDATWTLTTGEDGKYVITIGGDVTSLPAASSDWGLDSYKADVTKVVITAPITSLSGVVRTMFTKAEIIELPTSCKTIEGSALNDYRSLHTVYTTGQEMVEGTFNLSNITLVRGYALVWNAMDTVIIGENCTFSGSAMFWQTNLSKVVISEGATIGTQSFVSGTSAYDGRVWKDTSVEFPKSMGVIPAAAFYGNQGTDLSTVFPNNVVVEITVKNPDALFAIATNATANDYEGFVTWMSALETVKGTVGSTAETFVNWANEYFAENEIDRAITFEAIDTVASGMPIGDDLYFRILDDGNGKYIFDIYGTGTTAQAMSTSGEYLAGGYPNFVENDKYEETNYYQYCGKVSKIKFSAPNLTKISGYLFQEMGAQILELHPNMTNINSDAFNGLTTLTTVYTTGQTPEIGVANLTNVPTIGGYVFYQNKFVKILLNENLTSIGKYTFGNATKLEMIEIPAKVTSIDANAFVNASNLKYISFGADSFTYSSSSFSGICADVTIAGKTGSTAETLAEEKGVQFIDSAYINEIVAVYSNGNSVILLDKVDDKNVTAYATGSATYFNMGYTNYDTAVNKDKNGHLRVWDKYKSLITKAIYVNPGFTKIDSSFATHANLKTVEIPASVTAITASGFNGSGLTTLYITGNAVKEGVIDLSNITSLGSMCMASAKAHTILLNDNLSGAWGQNLFFRCDNLLYIRVPVGVTSLDGTTFFNSSKLNTVLFESKTTVIGASAFSGCTGLKTIIGYRGSTAETYANANGLEFIPLETESLLTFEGYEIREKDYNGLRSIFTANPAAMAALEAKGLKVVEYGSLLASTDKLNDAGVELTIAKNADGEYASHSFAVVSPIYQKGFRVGKILSESETAIEYACTVTYFNESNYTKNVTFRGYIVYEDKEGNDYVVYANLIGADGEIYNSTNLEFVCQGMIADGIDLSANISWLDVLKFRENLVK